MNEEIRDLQHELQEFMREQRESNKRVEDMLAQLIEILVSPNCSAEREERFGTKIRAIGERYRSVC